MLSLADKIYISLTAYMFILGYFVTKYERKLPGFLIRCFKYGCFAYKGAGGGFIQAIELPKALFTHFYAFSSLFGAVLFAYMISVYVFHRAVDAFCLRMLNLVSETTEPTVSAGASALTLLLVLMQCSRRWYETRRLQVFSSSSKINLTHYLLAIYHYFGVVAATVAEAPLFSGVQDRTNIKWLDTYTCWLAIPCLVVFAWASFEQNRSNVILANLRRDKKSGEVVSEEYKIPRGRLFEYVSSPHRFCEIFIYLVLVLLMPTKTYRCIFVWVICNQVFTALYTHNWYRNTFKNYPTNRKAIFPGVL